MSTPVQNPPALVGAGLPQVNTPGQRANSSTGFLPAFDFEVVEPSESAEPDHAIDLTGTKHDSTNVAVSPEQDASHVQEEAPRSWKWALNKLTKLVIETKGAATGEVVKFVMKHLAGTKLIFVVGKAGTGKTTILAELTGLPGLEPGKTLKSGTKEYHVCPAIIDDEQYLFIDTAGFGDPDRDDIDIFRNTVSCLVAFGSFVQVVGVLFVIGNPGTRLDQQDSRTLRWLQCFCGPAFFRNITFVTSFWDSYNDESFQQAYSRMQSLDEDKVLCQVLRPSSLEKRYHGAYLYHHGVAGGRLTPDSYPGLSVNKKKAERREELCNLIRLRYAELKYKPVKLQFMMEVENKVSFLDTEAAKVLRAPAVGVAIRVVDGKCIIEAEKKTEETPPLHFEEAPEEKPMSWRKTIYEWYDVVVRVTKYFREARAEEISAIASAWQSIRDWWSINKLRSELENWLADTSIIKPQIVSEVVRTVLTKHKFTAEDVKSSPSRCLALQQLILEAQALAEKEALQRSSWFISDRSGVDPLVYARKYVSADAALEMQRQSAWIEVKARMSASLIVVCEAGTPWLTDNGVRLMPGNEEAWMQLFDEFCGLLDEVGL
ncbi:hypothetical protein NCS56_00494700 [Fusarium sp. Ph1]|nr:hypothetical protein NCS56_00494700 [Fusarium sp. Ph1]